MDASVYGTVTDSSGTPLSGVVVSAAIYQVVQSSAETASDGTFTLSALPPGVYTLQANLANYAKSARALTLSVATAQQNFKLFPLPAAPGVVQTARQAPLAFTQPPTGPMGSTLLIFDGTEFVPITQQNAPSQDEMTIVLTHGWTRDPVCDVNTGIAGWPTDMARTLRANGVTPEQANIVGWDWFQAADACPLPPQENTPPQGVALGQALLATFGANYAQPIDFLGHSLGTMVNASAANYLHGDGTAQQSVSPTPWSPSQTHMTLFDQAELSGVANEQVLFDGLTVDLENPVGVLIYAAQVLQGWGAINAGSLCLGGQLYFVCRILFTKYLQYRLARCRWHFGIGRD